MTGKMTMFILCCALALFFPAHERNGFAADVETAGNLAVEGTVRAGGGITFPDNSTQRSACSGCANGILSIELGGTGASSALQAQSNLGVPGLYVPNIFTADQTIQGDVTLGGNLYLPAASSTAGIIYSGTYTLIHANGSSNFFAGLNTGNLAMTGYSNTASGYYALNSNTSGSRITAIGAQALNANTTGGDSTAVGAGALQRNTTGKFNTATGTLALYYAVTVDDNTADGTYALMNNTAGNSNTATGSHALTGNTSGLANTANGAYALQSNTTGNYNTATGRRALYYNNGFDNTATGSDSLSSNTSGYWNTATGYVALGSNTSGNGNTATGIQSLQSNTSGNYNTAVGRLAGNTNATGNDNTFVGYFSDASASDLTNATAIGYNAKVDASNHVRIGNTSVSQIGGEVAWSNLSDMRVKKDIGKIAFGLDFIKSLRPVQFRLKDGNDRIDFGFIAQDIEALLGDDYNVLGIGGDPERTLSLRYTDFIAPMVKALQEQQAIIDRQGEMIEKLNSEVGELERLRAEIAELKRLLGPVR